MTYSYEIKPLMNKSKEKEVIKLFEEASLFVTKIHNIQWRNFFITGKFYNSKIVKLTELNEKYPNLKKTKLSERYKRNLLIQTTGTLSSYLSNRKQDYNKIIYRSDFDKNTKHN